MRPFMIINLLYLNSRDFLAALTEVVHKIMCLHPPASFTPTSSRRALAAMLPPQSRPNRHRAAPNPERFILGRQAGAAHLRSSLLPYLSADHTRRWQASAGGTA